jgi:hypothetical protein
MEGEAFHQFLNRAKIPFALCAAFGVCRPAISGLVFDCYQACKDSDLISYNLIAWFAVHQHLRNLASPIVLPTCSLFPPRGNSQACRSLQIGTWAVSLIN